MGQGAARRPDFFIVGAPRSGTTALWQYLKQHPQVFMPAEEKEPLYFGADLRFTTPRTTAEAYRALFADAADGQRHGEGSAYYLVSEDAPDELLGYCAPQVPQVIVMLRDPVAIMRSMHGLLVYKGEENIEDLASALDAEPARKNGRDVAPHATFLNAHYYRTTARLGSHVRRYLARFPRERVHFIVYDDFHDDTAAEYRRTLAFLDVDEAFAPEFEVVNASLRPRSRTLGQAINGTSRFFALGPGRVLRGPLRRPLVRGRDIVRSWNSAPPANDREADLDARLRAEFAPEVEVLSELIGRDLTPWSAGGHVDKSPARV